MPVEVGVIGGMGPAATVLFMGHIVRRTPASRDQDHIPLIVISDPRLPDRSKHIEGRGASPLRSLLQIAARLEGLGARLLVMPCNTAHLFWEEISRNSTVPCLNMIDEVVRRLDSLGESETVALMATRGTVKAGIYEQAVEPSGHLLLPPDPELQQRTDELIEKLKAGRDRPSLLRELEAVADRWFSRGADRVIFGCTELGLLYDSLEEDDRFVDSTALLAEATVEQSLLMGRIRGSS